MFRKAYSNPIVFSLLPALSIIPVLIGYSKGFHLGGLKTIINFFSSSLSPSLDPVVIKASFEGIQSTICIAFISWFLSTFVGIFLGVLSSNIFWESINKPKLYSTSIKAILALPRSIHEIIWGLLLLQLYGISPWVAILAIVIPYASITARVIANQLDSLDKSSFIAIKLSSKVIPAFITALGPKIMPILISYGGYRLECALRSATLLGVFGLGGIGTELILTLQSLQFNQMWTSLWMLLITMIILESSINIWKGNKILKISPELIGPITISLLLILFLIILTWSNIIGIELFNGIHFNPIPIPSLNDIKRALTELPIIKQTIITITLTLLASGIAIGTPPVVTIIMPGKIGTYIQRIIWTLLRLIPAPLIALILILCTNPNLWVASLALGLNNAGIMGRLLLEGSLEETSSLYSAILSLGSNKRSAWIYGILSKESKRYLAYAAYRSDVLLRETAIVGVIGGIGLGWQLQESLTSFAWGEVIIILTMYSSITIIGEYISDKFHQKWINTNNRESFAIKVKN